MPPPTSEKVLPEEQLARWSRTSTGGLSTAADQLARVAHLPAVRPLLTIKKAEKLLSAFGPKLRQLVNPETGRLHPHRWTRPLRCWMRLVFEDARGDLAARRPVSKRARGLAAWSRASEPGAAGAGQRCARRAVNAVH